jgi:hypothetical protein
MPVPFVRDHSVSTNGDGPAPTGMASSSATQRIRGYRGACASACTCDRPMRGLRADVKSRLVASWSGSSGGSLSESLIGGFNEPHEPVVQLSRRIVIVMDSIVSSDADTAMTTVAVLRIRRTGGSAISSRRRETPDRSASGIQRRASVTAMSQVSSDAYKRRRIAAE